MKDEIIIPVLKEEDFVAANLRRDKYALSRDLLAQESNKAIAARLMAMSRNQIKCDKCGKEFEAGISSDGLLTCSECK
jgi:late competence protein required for DNA uptake (superfamily II DNA/RNA helicase)